MKALFNRQSEIFYYSQECIIDSQKHDMSVDMLSLEALLPQATFYIASADIQLCLGYVKEICREAAGVIY